MFPPWRGRKNEGSFPSAGEGDYSPLLPSPGGRGWGRGYQNTFSTMKCLSYLNNIRSILTPRKEGISPELTNMLVFPRFHVGGKEAGKCL